MVRGSATDQRPGVRIAGGRTAGPARARDAEFTEAANEDSGPIEALPANNSHVARLHTVVDDHPDESFALIRKWLHETDEEEAA